MKDEEFKKIISDCFGDFIKNFQFDLICVPSNISNKILLINNRCIVRFMYSIEGFSCDLIDPVEKSEKEKIVRKDGFPTGYSIYPVHSVWKFLYPNDKEDFGQRGKDLIGELNIIKKLLLKRLINIVKGDFSWRDSFLKRRNEINAKLSYMSEHWAMDNPIRLKLKKGDPSWEKDFDEYKAFLDSLNK